MKDISFADLDRLSIRTGVETESNRQADMELRRRGYRFDANEQRWIREQSDSALGVRGVGDDQP